MNDLFRTYVHSTRYEFYIESISAQHVSMLLGIFSKAAREPENEARRRYDSTDCISIIRHKALIITAH